MDSWQTSPKGFHCRDGKHTSVPIGFYEGIMEHTSPLHIQVFIDVLYICYTFLPRPHNAIDPSSLVVVSYLLPLKAQTPQFPALIS